MKRVYNKWTEEQLAFVMIKRAEGKEWKELAKLFNQRFGVNRSWQTIMQKVNNSPNVITTPKKKKKAFTSKELEYMKEVRYKMTYQEIADKLGRSLQSVRNKFAYMDRREKASKKTDDVLDWRHDKASRKQLRFVASLVLNNPTQEQIRQFVTSNENMTKGDADAIINQKRRDEVSEKPPVKTLSRKTETPSRKFSKKDDMRILTDFYELSITEAREEFGIPYYLVAKRLEELFDSEKPQHISMLKEASEIVRKRKAIANMGFFAKRRMKRNEKKVAKLKAQLNKLGSE